MNKRKRKKKRKKLYKEIIEDVALEISLDSEWRKKIFNLRSNASLEISYSDPVTIPKYIKYFITYYKLEFIVKKVSYCKENFDEIFEIFEFSSKEFPKIIRFTGNNPNIV